MNRLSAVSVAMDAFLLSAIPLTAQQASPQQLQTTTAESTRVIPVCSSPQANTAHVAWGKFGLQFDVPTGEVKISGKRSDGTTFTS